MATGSSADFLSRLKRLLPAGWFNSSAPNRDAVLGGLSDVQSWLYGFIAFAKAQMRLATAAGIFIDLWCYDYLGMNLVRSIGEGDTPFAARVAKEVTRVRVSRPGVAQALYDLTGQTPVIFEPFNGGDTGGWAHGVGSGATSGACGWDSGGAWGSSLMPGQVLITVYVNSNLGVSGIGGWATGVGSGATSGALAWDSGSGEWITTQNVQGAITNQMIYDTINRNKAEGVICWVRIVQGASPLPPL